MRIEFTYARRPDYFQDPRAARSGNPSTAYVLAALVILLGTLASTVPSGIPHAGQIGTGLIILGLIWVVVIIRAHGRPTGPAVSADMSQPRHWLITEEGVTSESELTTSRYPWTAFHGVTVWPHTYLLHQTQQNVRIDIPREPLTADEDAALGALFAQLRPVRRTPEPVEVTVRLALATAPPDQSHPVQAPPAGPQWLLTGESLRLRTPDRDLTWRWPAVARVQVTPAEYRFWQRYGIALTLPRAALTAAQEASLEEFLAGRGLR